ncbi:MAG: hypothetical protein GX957_05040 [Clostridiaceae bacterium]|nr:hypothetical protein [Clostridiaceae bacterium]
MKKLICLFVILSLSLFVGCTTTSSLSEPLSKAETTPTTALENKKPYLIPDWVEFGMTENEIKSIETKEIKHDFRGELTYKIDRYPDLNGCQTEDILYAFNSDGELMVISYDLGTYYADDSDFSISNYENLKKYMCDIYGNDFDEKEIWDNEFYINQPQNWDKAIATGDLTLSVSWVNEDNVKALIVWSNDKRVVEYQDMSRLI